MRKSLVAALLLGPTVLGCAGAPGGAEAQTWRTTVSERQVWDRSPLQVEITYGAGTLRIHPADAPTLYRMEMSYDEETFTPRAEYDEEGRRLRLGTSDIILEGRRRSGRERSEATIGLTREVPLDLSLEFGAGSASIELGGMNVQRVGLKTGASETRVNFSVPNAGRAERVGIEAGAADLRVVGLGNARAREISFQGGVGATVLDFGGAWDGDGVASVQMGVGSVTLRLPRSMGVRINRSSFLTSFSGPGLERDGNSYYSGNWQTAPHRLTIDISAALGAINVQWID
jgi:hypothetical protein